MECFICMLCCGCLEHPVPSVWKNFYKWRCFGTVSTPFYAVIYEHQSMVSIPWKIWTLFQPMLTLRIPNLPIQVHQHMRMVVSHWSVQLPVPSKGINDLWLHVYGPVQVGH